MTKTQKIIVTPVRIPCDFAVESPFNIDIQLENNAPSLLTADIEDLRCVFDPQDLDESSAELAWTLENL